MAACEKHPEFHAERGKGRETAEDPDADEQPRGFAAIATPRECADEQAHQQATGDIDRQRLPRETGAAPRAHRLPDEMARTSADRAADQEGKQAVHGLVLSGNEPKAKWTFPITRRHQTLPETPVVS